MKITDSNTTELFEEISDEEATQVYGGGIWDVVSKVSNVITLYQAARSAYITVSDAYRASNGSGAFDGSSTYDALGNITSFGGYSSSGGGSRNYIYPTASE